MAVVLVVEDEVLIRLTALDYVEQAGHTAIEASGADVTDKCGWLYTP